MKIKGIYIDKFGFLEGMSLEGIPDGLSVFLGSNEAGKSTLLSFIRCMMFGFPDGRSKENQYLPRDGGGRSGRLHLLTDSGQTCLLERSEGKGGGDVSLTMNDDNGGGQEALDRLLGGVNRELYGNIFAFSLSELQQFETLTGDELETAIYGAGAGLGRISLPQLEGRLDAEMGTIFKKRGTKPELNQLLAKMEEIGQGKAEAAARTEEFDQLHEQIDRINKTIAELKGHEAELNLAVKRTDRKLEAWNDWVDLDRAKKDLGELPEVKSFPQDGIGRLERLAEKRRDLGAFIKDAEARKVETLKEKENVEENEKILRHKSEIQALQRGREYFENQKKECKDLRDLIGKLDGRIQKLLENMGSDWTPQRIHEIGPLISKGEIARKWDNEIKSTEEDIGNAAVRLQTIDSALERAKQKEKLDQQKLENTPEPVIKDQQQITKEKNELKAIRTQLHRIDELEAEQQALARDIARANNALDMVKDLGGPIDPGAMKWAAYVAAGIMAVLGAIGLAVGYPDYGLLLLVLAAASLFSYAWYCKKSQTKNLRFDKRKREIKTKLEVSGRNRERTAAALEQRRMQLAEICKAASLDVPNGPAEIEARIEDVEEALSHLTEWRGSKEAFEEASTEVEYITKERQTIINQLDSLKKDLASKKTDWQEWLETNGLPGELTPQGALALFELAEECRKLVQQRDDWTERKRKADEYVAEYENNVKALIVECSFETNGEDDPGRCLDAMACAIETAESARNRRIELDKEAARAQQEINKFTKQREEVKREIQTLLSEAGAENEENFRELGQIKEKRLELEERISRNRQSIRKSAGTGPEADEFMREIGSTTKSRLEIELQENQNKLTHVREKIADADQQFGGLKNGLDALKEKGTVGEFRLAEEQLLARMRELADQWSSRALACRLLRMARERYERERQPEVIKNAGVFFSTITGGRYKSIISPPGDNTLTVVDNMKRRHELKHLSRGTEEQLYFALRLGLIREFCSQQEALPVIMDDVTVNFDPNRACAAIKAIKQLAETHQVFFFTCHPSTSDLITEAYPAVQLYRMEEGNISG